MKQVEMDRNTMVCPHCLNVYEYRYSQRLCPEDGYKLHLLVEFAPIADNLFGGIYKVKIKGEPVDLRIKE